MQNARASAGLGVVSEQNIGTDPAMLIVGHGSRDPRGAEEFHRLVELVR